MIMNHTNYDYESPKYGIKPVFFWIICESICESLMKDFANFLATFL